MKQSIIVLSLSLFFSAFVYSQTEEPDLNLETIFKTHDLKIRYEAVAHLFEKRETRQTIIFEKNPSSLNMLNRLSELIIGVSIYPEKYDSLSLGKCDKQEEVHSNFSAMSDMKILKNVAVEWMSDEEIDSFIEQIGTTPKEAFKEYQDFIRNIKDEKEIYLNCIDVELAKGDESKYADEDLYYNFKDPMSSLLSPGISKLDFLKVFKEFILNNNEDILPDVLRIKSFWNDHSSKVLEYLEQNKHLF